VIFSLFDVVLYRSVQSIQQGEEATKIEVGFGMIFEAVCFSCYWTVQTDYWHTFQGAFFVGKVVQQYGLGMNFEAKNCGTILVYCKWISLARICIVVADIYFPQDE
jgi:hypothetical protein